MPVKPSSRVDKQLALRPASASHLARRRLSLEPLEERTLLTALQGGNLVVYRVGTGTGTLVNTGNPVFLDEYTPAGTLVQSIALPAVHSESNQFPLIASGTATSEGALLRSADGRFLSFTGYAAEPGETAPTGLNNSGAGRTVGRISIDGSLDTSTLIGASFGDPGSFPGTPDNPRSAITLDGSQFWVTAGSSGMVYTLLGGVQDNQPLLSSPNLRTVGIDNGKLYISSQTNGFTLAQVGTGLPTSGLQTVTNLPGMPTSGQSVNNFFFAHLNPADPGTAADTVYLSSQSGFVTKFSLVGGTWVSNGASPIVVGGIRGLTGVVNNSTSTPTVTLYGANGDGDVDGGGQLYVYADTSGYNAAPTAVSPVKIADAGVNTAFRGIAIAPNVAPVLDISVSPALNAIIEDVSNAANTGTLVSDVISRLGGAKIIDAGQTKQGIAITSVDNTNGVWEYTINGGGVWTPFGAPSLAAARLLASDANSRVRFVPNLNFNGSVNPAITFKAWDQSVGANGGTFNATLNGSFYGFSAASVNATLAITAVNDAPSFIRGGDQLIAASAPAQTIANWATSIAKGPTADESGQTVNFQITGNTFPGLFLIAPAVSSTGTLTYTPFGIAGTATITLVLKDNGGTANSGIDTSAQQTFEITINADGTNQPPLITGPNVAQTTLEDTALVFSIANGNKISYANFDSAGNEQITLTVLGGTVSLSTLTGLTGTGNGTASLSYTGTKTDLNAALDSLTFTPSQDLNGTAAASIQLVVNDLQSGLPGGAKSDSRTFVINVTPVNDRPTFTAGSSKILAEDSPAQSFSGWATSISAGPPDENSQSVNFQLTNDNNSMFTVQPTVANDGTLSFTPKPNAYGLANVTARLIDNGGTANSGNDTSLPHVFTITITPINDPPQITAPLGTQRHVRNTPLLFAAREFNQISLADIDSEGASEQATLTATNGTLSLATLAFLSGTGNGTASLTYSGSIAALNVALDGLIFTPTTNFTGAASVQVSINDQGHTGTGGQLAANTTVNINVVAPSSLLINELYLNPPNNDLPNSYLEFRSPLQNNYTIPNNTYLLAITGDPAPVDATTTASIGTIVDMFDLSGMQTGSNGMLVLLMKDNTYVTNGLVNPSSAIRDNTAIGTGAGYGNNFVAPGSSVVGHSAIPRAQDVQILHPSATYLLVQSSSPIFMSSNYDSLDLDVGDTGTLHGTLFNQFTVLDAVAGMEDNTQGVDPAEFGYGYLNFENPPGGQPSANIFTPNSRVVTGNFSAKYIARSGNTLGWAASDWVAGDVPEDTIPPSFALSSPNNVSPPGYAFRPLNHLGAPNFTTLAPALDLNGPPGGTSNTVTYTGSPIVLALPAATLSDGDNANLYSLSVSLPNAQLGDLLDVSLSAFPLITKAFNGSQLTLTGFDTVANYQTLLRSISYSNTIPGGPGVSSEVANVVVSDGIASSNTAVGTINVSLAAGSVLQSALVFYDGSSYDNGVGFTSGDDAAVDTSKIAYLPGGGAATFAAVTAYTNGITGIMVDLKGTGAHSSITAADFKFRVGTTNTPNATPWATATAPTAVNASRTGQGASGSDRIEIFWAAGAIKNTWLEVTVLANPSTTGLAANAIFYFGHMMADSGQGDTLALFQTNASDQIAPRQNGAAGVVVTNSFDYNKDKNVNATDQIFARQNGGSLPAITIANPPGAPSLGLSAAPAVSTTTSSTLTASPTATTSSAGDSGVASALASKSGDGSGTPAAGWIRHRLATIDLNSGRIARFFHHLADVNTPESHRILQKADEVADSLGLDHHVLDDILASLFS